MQQKSWQLFLWKSDDVTDMGPITLPSFIQVRIEQREIANKESNDLGGKGVNFNRFLISGNRAVFRKNRGLLQGHTHTSTSTCVPLPIQIRNFPHELFF